MNVRYLQLIECSPCILYSWILVWLRSFPVFSWSDVTITTVVHWSFVLVWIPPQPRLDPDAAGGRGGVNLWVHCQHGVRCGCANRTKRNENICDWLTDACCWTVLLLRSVSFDVTRSRELSALTHVRRSGPLNRKDLQRLCWFYSLDFTLVFANVTASSPLQCASVWKIQLKK